MAEPVRFAIEEVTVDGAGGALVSDLSIAVDPGEVLGITGPSGSGKSSLIHVLAGLEAPAAGRLLLGDRPARLRGDAGVGLILQHHHLPGMLTAHEAVGLPLQAAAWTAPTSPGAATGCSSRSGSASTPGS